MKMQKWNHEKGMYEPYVIPADWECPLFCDDMQSVVNCASCGREIVYANCYTSMEIHDDWGFGFAVCQECYKGELERRIDRAIRKGEV